MTGPALFWLDAHYSGGETAHSKNKATPIQDELNKILSSEYDNVILIDDARFFWVGNYNYPDLTQLCSWIETEGGLNVTVENDIVRVTPQYKHDSLYYLRQQRV